MTTKLQVIRVPEVQPPRSTPADQMGVWRKLEEARSIIDRNFHALRDAIDRAILTGGLIAPGTVTLEMLDDISLIGDVTGELGATGGTTVEKIRNVTIPAPAAGDDGKAVVYNHSGPAFTYTDKLTDVLTTRGDLLYRGASAEARLGIGGANTLLKSDGTDPSWSTLTALLDALFSSTQGAVLYRGSSAWAALGPGTSGDFLQTQGAGANPQWASAAGGAAHALLSGTHTDADTETVVAGDLVYGNATPKWDRLPVGSDGDILTVVSGAPAWAAASGGSNHELLSATHTDTVAATVVRGDLIVGNSTPEWERLARGSQGDILRIFGSDPGWRLLKRHARATTHHMILDVHCLDNLGIEQNGSVNIGTLGAAAAGADATRASRKSTSATTCGLRQTASLLIQPQHYPYFRCDFRILASTNGFFWAGLSTVEPGAAAAVGSGHFVLLRWVQGTDTNFQVSTRDGTTQTQTDSGVAKDANWHDLEIFTDDGGSTWQVWIDGVQVFDANTTVPGTTQTMGAFCLLKATAAGGLELNQSYLNVQLNPSLA